MKESTKSGKPHVLVVKLSSLGDLFHALPTVHNLKVGLDAEIDWVTQQEYVDLVRCFTDVDRVIPFYRRSFFTDLRPFLRELRTHKYDYIIDLQGLLKSAIVVMLAKGRERIGPSFHREGSHFFYSAIAGKRNKNRHAVEQNLDIVRYLGLDLVEPAFPVKFPRKNLNEKRPRVAILPSSRWPTKTWPTQYFIDVARRLHETSDVSLFLLGSPDDIQVCGEIERGFGGRVVNMAGKAALVDTGGILQEMDLLIANDSGPVHMAAAIGIPTLVIFGPTDPDRTGPYDNQHRVAKASLSCQPCFSRTCARRDNACLYAVTPEMVSDIAITMLTRNVEKCCECGC